MFEPTRWRPDYPNLAFERLDDGDAYWGAKIVTVMAFDDETVRGLARAAEYSRLEVTALVEDVLKRRRDAIGRYYVLGWTHGARSTHAGPDHGGR